MPLKYCHEHPNATVTWLDDCRGVCPVCEQLETERAKRKVIFSNEKFRTLVTRHLSDASDWMSEVQAAINRLNHALEELEDKAPSKGE